MYVVLVINKLDYIQFVWYVKMYNNLFLGKLVNIMHIRFSLQIHLVLHVV